MALIERDEFPFEFLSRLAERESWRKEIHRPIYHVHKWWAKRLGSVFRGILLGSVLERGDLQAAFYSRHAFGNVVVFDPFIGSGTTVGEAHKLGFTALGRDINPIATESVRVALGPLEKARLQAALVELLDGVGERIRQLYRSKDSLGHECEVLYYFWVMQTDCPKCSSRMDLFPSYVVASNAYPQKKPEVQVVCPSCGDVFRASSRHDEVSCRSCSTTFHPGVAPTRGAKATCNACANEFPVMESIGGKRPDFRLYAKLVLTANGTKEYLRTDRDDEALYQQCSSMLEAAVRNGELSLPNLALEDGYNTRQAINYGFRSWSDFFNDRQLLALGWLRRAILALGDEPTRAAMLVLFSGLLEFNNLFTSYKGEGTGAVRHMFAHHILKPERVPIEANVWGTAKSSGSFTGLFKTRLLRAIEYRQYPAEVNGMADTSVVCSPPFSGHVEQGWPESGQFVQRGIYISCGDSANASLPDRTVDLVVTDPPFFDNVHYSELADFFSAWRPVVAEKSRTTRNIAEVQDSDADRFSEKLKGVFAECHRILKDDGLLVFTYHHSRLEGWRALASAILGARFAVVNAHPVKAEMSVATPKMQAKEPIQFDIILVCRKLEAILESPMTPERALDVARSKVDRLERAGFGLSTNDRRIVLVGQMLSTLRDEQAIVAIEGLAENEMEKHVSTTSGPALAI